MSHDEFVDLPESVLELGVLSETVDRADMVIIENR